MSIYQVYANTFCIHFQLSHKKYITIVMNFGFTWAWNVQCLNKWRKGPCMQILLQIHGMIGYWSKNDQFCYVSWKVFLSLKSRLLTRTWDRDHSQNGYCCVRNSGYTPGLVYKANLRNPIQGADQVTSEVQRTVKFLSSGKKNPRGVWHYSCLLLTGRSLKKTWG